MTTTVHWLGAGLSTHPGIYRLATLEVPLLVWNRTVSRAEAALGENPPASAEARELDWQLLEDSVNAGDVVVSMLPADRHVEVAALCLRRGAHFVSSSYVSADLLALNDQAMREGLVMLNEVGLDPGIDHLFAERLVSAWRASTHYREDARLRFRSYCGGFPAIANAFRYKFSWSPVGVLRALKSPARWKRGGEILDTDTPWKALQTYSVPLRSGQREQFEAYPNRDSLPFEWQYGFERHWQVDEFVRGTLRLSGWADAWAPLFEEIDAMDMATADARLTELSEDLWSRYAYDPDEADRVVLSVELDAVDEHGAAIWQQGLYLDETGNAAGSAMARLVSWPVSLAVQAVLAGRVPAGVHAGISDAPLVADWLDALGELGVVVYQAAPQVSDRR